MDQEEHTWQDVANYILEGSRELPECRGSLFERGANREPIAGCALGAGQYAAGYVALRRDRRDGWRSYLKAQTELQILYLGHFRALIAYDNDAHGRDHVLANIKELLNQDSSDV